VTARRHGHGIIASYRRNLLAEKYQTCSRRTALRSAAAEMPRQQTIQAITAGRKHRSSRNGTERATRRGLFARINAAKTHIALWQYQYIKAAWASWRRVAHEQSAWHQHQ